MKKIVLSMFVIGLIGLPAYAQKDENDRIKNSGKVMSEILNIPDDVPADLLDKAECVIVLPSVMKAAFIVGGSYPRFQYGGYSFSVVDPWPEYWSDNWYDNDYMYIENAGDGYYLYNRGYPQDRIALNVYAN